MIFAGYLWAQPYFLLLLLSIPILYYFLQIKESQKSTLQISSTTKYKKWQNKGRVIWVKLNEILFYISLVFLIIALARPQTTDTKLKRTLDGLDIVIVLDVSDSMLIEDTKPFNRIESAKETIIRFVQKRTSDRIGVVIFAGEAFTLVPPTLDYDLIINRIGQIQTAADAKIKDGTAIGVAMGAGAARLKDSQAKSRVMIFLTDGENNSGTIDPETGLEIAKGYGIKIYSIGLGESGPTKLPIYTRDMFGQKVKRYQSFESTVNDELLSQMAVVTGGKYFRANKENSLENVFNEINKLETTKIEDQKFVKYNEHYAFYLTTGMFLLFLNLLLKQTFLKRGP